jgi:hypothetical protein
MHCADVSFCLLEARFLASGSCSLHCKACWFASRLLQSRFAAARWIITPCCLLLLLLAFFFLHCVVAWTTAL